jgi:hypothetical protein
MFRSLDCFKKSGRSGFTTAAPLRVGCRYCFVGGPRGIFAICHAFLQEGGARSALQLLVVRAERARRQFVFGVDRK